MRPTYAQARGYFLLLLLFAVLAVACDGTSQAQLIAAYPHVKTDPPRGTQQVVLELTVPDAAGAAGEVRVLVGQYGGYVSTSYASRREGVHVASLTAQLPASRYPAFREALREQGRVTRERETPVAVYPVPTTVDVQIMLHSGAAAPVDVSQVLAPMSERLRAAYGFLIALRDTWRSALVWLGLVCVPVALMALGVLQLLQWLRRSNSPAKEDNPFKKYGGER